MEFNQLQLLFLRLNLYWKHILIMINKYIKYDELIIKKTVIIN